MTLLLNASAVTQLIGHLDPVFEALKAGFEQPPDRQVIPGQRMRTDLPGSGTATVLLPGLLRGIPAYTVKTNAKFPDASPALRGLVCLHSLRDGELLAVLDSATVTAWRTGLAAALATDTLAARTADTVAVIGAGAQARTTLRGLAHRRRVTTLTVHDLRRARALELAEHARDRFGVASKIAETAGEAAVSSEIVILATWSRTPLLEATDIRAGQHLTSLGADEPGKQALAPELLRQATLIVDDPDLAAQTGAIANAKLPASTIDATLSQVMLGHRAGRSNGDEITVYTPVGLPWQDLALAWPVYRAALTDESRLEFDFLT